MEHPAPFTQPALCIIRLMATDTDVLVIGAGISGLTAAFELQRRGLRVEAIDAAERAGGVIGTVRENGFLYERGPNSILDTGPLIGALLEDLGIRGERVEMKASAAKRYVLRHGRLIALPMSPRALVTTPLFSLRAKLRLLREPFIAVEAAADETVAQFVRRRLGAELLDYAIEPFVAGIHAGDPDELSIEAAFPRLHALERRDGSLVKGQVRGARGKRAARSFSFVSGMQTLTDALASRVRVDTARRAAALSRCEDGRIEAHIQSRAGDLRIRAHAVVLATPADAAAELVSTFSPDAAIALNAIPYAAVVSVARAYRRADIAHPLDGFGFLVPRVETRRILGALFSSSAFEGRAPADHVVVTAFVGGRRDAALAGEPVSGIDRIVSEELSALIGARAQPLTSIVTAWPRAIPQYTIGHLDRVRRAAAAQSALPGLFLCGAYRGGIAVGDCITSAHETAQRVAAHLASTPRARPRA